MADIAGTAGDEDVLEHCKPVLLTIDTADDAFPDRLARRQLVACRERVVPEHRDGLARVDVEVLADQIELLQQVGGQRDDVAADGIGLEQVEQFARAGPEQLRRRAIRQLESLGLRVTLDAA